jgi:phosphoglycerate dehydrogenase-like enzyme
MRPRLLVSAGLDLFSSFFSSQQLERMSRKFDWERTAARTCNAAFLRQLANADGLVTTWDSPFLEEHSLDDAPQLRVIAHCGGEVKSRFAPPLFDKLTITNAADPMGRATAEMAATFLLYCARDVDRYREALRKPTNRAYSNAHFYGTDEFLVNREVGMIGFGRVGRALVGLTSGFELRWNVYDPFAPRSLARQYGIAFSALTPLLRRAELLVLTAALTNRTRGLLNRSRLAILPDGAAVINVARGGLIDLAALTREVRRKRLRCALDVTDPDEPLPLKHPLRNLPGAIVTPHIAGSGRHVRHEMASTVLDDLENFFQRKPVKHRVTRAMLQRMT